MANELWSFGYNQLGTIGDGTTFQRIEPVNITGSWIAISTGQNSSGGIKSDNTLWTWGVNSYGQLGLSNVITQVTPVQVSGLWKYMSMSTTSAAIKTDNTLWTWGQNNYGQLGDLTLANKSAPVQITGSWLTVATATNHTAAIRSDNTLWTCGLNNFGQLGQNNVTNSSTIVQVTGSWSKIAIGYSHTAALKTDGTLWTWGDNTFGQLGLGVATNVHKSSPVQITGTCIAVSAYGNNTAVITAANQLFVWGCNQFGITGNYATTISNLPVLVTGTWLDVKVGYGHIVATKSDGTVWGWGQNSAGQLGIGNTVNQLVPTQLPGTTYLANISTGFYNTLALSSGAGTFTYNANGSTSGTVPVDTHVYLLGTTDKVEFNTGTLAKTNYIFNGWNTLANGLGTAYQVGSQIAVSALTTTLYSQWLTPPSQSSLWSCGFNTDGQLGDNTILPKSAIVNVSAGQTWTNIAAGMYRHCLGITTNGDLYSWGNNTYGQLGKADVISRSSPVLVDSGSNWTKVSGGFYHSAAINDLNQLWTCGYNTFGQLGDGTFTNKSSLVQVGAGKLWANVSCGTQHTAAVTTVTNSLWVWGDNAYGQLAQNNTLGSSVPVQIAGNWKKVTCGSANILAINDINQLYACGENTFYQLGDGTTAHRSVMTQIAAGTTWSDVACGMSHTIAINTAGELWGWGLNNYGQLGLGDTVNRTQMVKISSATNWTSVYCGGNSLSAVLNTAGELWVCGLGSQGILGQFNTVSRSTLVQVNPGTHWGTMSANSSTLYAIATLTAPVTPAPTTTPPPSTPVPTPVPTTAPVPVTPIPVVQGNLIVGADYNYRSWGSTNGGTYVASPTNIAINRGTGTGRYGLGGSVAALNPVVATNVVGSSKWSDLILAINNTRNYQSSGYTNIPTIYSGSTITAAEINARIAAENNTAIQQLGTCAVTQLSSPTTLSVVSPGNVIQLSFVQSVTFSTADRARYFFNAGNTIQLSFAKTGSSVNARNVSWDDLLAACGTIEIGYNNTTKIGGSQTPFVLLNTNNNGGYWNLSTINSTHFKQYSVAPFSSDYLEVLVKWDGTTSNGGYSTVTITVNCYWPNVHNTTIDGTCTTNVVLKTATTVHANTYLGSETWGTLSLPTGSAAKTDSPYATYGTQIGTSYCVGNDLYGTFANGTGGTYVAVIETNSGFCVIQTHSVTYNSNGSTTGTVPVDANSYISGDIINVSSNTGTLAKTGYTFAGWNTTADGSGTTYAVLSTALMGPGNIVFYAKWTVDKQLWAWGNNAFGNLGNDSIISTTSQIPVSTNITTWNTIESGWNHNAAITNAGELFVWGYNIYGQLGLTNRFDITSPIQIAGTWTAASCGSQHTAAIKSDGTLWTWGYNAHGQLGFNDTTNRYVPTILSAITTWLSVACGLYHTVAIKSDGTLWTWGYNNNGQLGDNSVTLKSSPVQVAGGGTWTNIATGNYHTAAIKTGGTLWTCGLNADGQLGDGTSVSKSSPIQIAGTWTNIATGGSHTAAIKSDNTLWTCGLNSDGQLGDNSVTSKSAPVQVSGGGNWLSVTCGNIHTAAITTAKSLFVFGLNSSGQCGDGSTVSKSNPVQVTGEWSSVSGGATHTIASRYISGTTYNVSYNGNGSSSGTTPATVAYAFGASVIILGNTGTLAKTGYTFDGWNTDANGVGTDRAAGSSFNMQTSAVILYAKWKATPHLWAWGNNATFGTLGDNTTVSKQIPVEVSGAGTWNAVTTNQYHSSAIKSDGTLWSWGYNAYGQLGDNSVAMRSAPVQVTGSGMWSGVANGLYHTAAIKSDGTLWSWGFNLLGALGNNTAITSFVPVQISGGGTWSCVTSGAYHTAAIKSDGTLWMWGYDLDGRLGTGTGLTVTSTPVQVGGGTWLLVDSSAYHTAAIKSDGTLYTWGKNTNAQLGDLTVINRSSPVQVSGGGTWLTVSCGSLHTAAIKTGGTLWTWGTGSYGGLGSGLTVSSSPVQVSGGGTWVAVSCGSLHTVAIKTDNTIWAWGNNTYGELGIDSLTNSATPVQVYGGGSTWKTVACGQFTTFATFGYDSVSYNVIYDGNSNTGGTTPATVSYAVGSTITVASNSGTLVRTSYIFDGWNTKADGTGTNRAIGTSFTLPASNITLYAKWLPSYVVAGYVVDGYVV